MTEALESVLDQFRPGFDVDGVVIVRIDHRPDACEECLIPDDMLGPMLKSAMQRVAPAVLHVELKHDHPA
jgi:hypothetical protein